MKFFLVQNSFEIRRDSPYKPRVLSQSEVSCVWEGNISERKTKSCSLQISLNKFCCVLVLRHYLFKRDRRPKDFPHLVHLWPSSSFSFCFSLLSSLTSGGGEISSSSSPGWLCCCWLTPMFFLPSKNVGSPLKAMACSRSLIAASWGLDFIFDEKNWSTWTSAHLSEEWETRCWSRVDLREKVLLQWRHVSFGRTLTFMNKLWISRRFIAKQPYL